MNIPKFSIVVAVSANNVIGNKGAMPWHIPDELAYFRNLTINHTVIMGRVTYESIGCPLDKRDNVVISNSLKSIEGCLVFDDFYAALHDVGQSTKKIFVIGGGSLYNLSIMHAEKLYVSRINKKYSGDTFFPEIDPAVWHADFTAEVYTRR